MRKLFLTLIALTALIGVKEIKAQEFFDTSDPEKFFTLGGRIGFNTSNRTFPTGNFANSMFTSWGTGFNIGAVANLNFKEYLTLQPGFFYESRSADLINIADYLTDYGNERTYYERNHLRGYYFTIPVMGILKFNLAERIRWSVEFGPYVQFCLNQTGQKNVNILYRPNQSDDYSYYIAKPTNVDVGFKMGSGLCFYDHYYIGFHYLAGLCHAWSLPAGGKNKSWMFSIGYDF